MPDNSFDIIISGGGIAGLAAAIAFGRAGFKVQCVDPSTPITERNQEGSDLRTTAFLQPAQTLLEQIGLWKDLEPHASALQVMRIVDAGGVTTEPRIIKDFNAQDISDKPFGWNLPNWLLRREFLAQAQDIATVDLRIGTKTVAFTSRADEASVALSDGSVSRARLVVAADGRHSTMRQQAGISVRTTRYGQKALAMAVTHPVPHENVSTEIHRSGGPFTLVPLPDYEGFPCSALVWMETAPQARRLFELPEAAFEAEMSARSGHLFGPLKLASRRTIWPIISQIASRMSGTRLALMAEAAHVVPPIGAQGLNLSLGDLGALLSLAQARPDNLGDQAMLDAYHRARFNEIKLRIQGIDLLNRTSMLKLPFLRDARAIGLETLYALPPVRKTLMQMGLGVR